MTLNTLTKNHSLQAHNTFGIDVMADYFLSFTTEETLIKYLPEINEFNLSPLLIGEGSNLLFLKDYNGVILMSQIKGFETITEDDNNIEVKVGSGVIWDDFVEWAVNNNYGGIENLSIIPGTVGASPVQNIGAYGVEAQDIITQVEAIELSTGEKRIFSNKDCQFAYRYSIFKNELKGKYAVSYVTYKLNKKPKFNLSYGNIANLLNGKEANLKHIRQVISEVRNSKLPDYKSLGNAGSFFTNPYISTEEYQKLKIKYPTIPHYPIDDQKVKVPAGWLIDQCGLKGKQHKNAAVHKEQALVLVNTGGASGKDIVELADIVINKVKAKFGITLIPEVNFIS